jgi:TolA-binding protein
MTSTRIRLASVVIGTVLLAGTAAVTAQDAASENFARRKYDQGRKFLQDKNYSEALKEFQSTVDSYPKSRVADAALLRIAEYQLDVAGDAAAAQAAVDKLLRDYEKSDSGPMAYVLAGRIIMSKGRAPNDVKTAVANYERVPGYFPGSDAVPASIYYAGEALRLTHREDEAVQRYRQVSTDYPESEWAPRALLGEARCLVLTGQPGRAMELLQRVRQRFAKSAEAKTAIEWNTILYRLYRRGPERPSFQFAAQKAFTGPSGRVKDIQALAVDDDGSVYASNRNAVLVYDASGKPGSSLSGNDIRAIMFDRVGRPVLFGRESVVAPEASSRSLSVPKPDGTPRFLNDITSGVLASTGDWLVVDSNAKNIARFSSAGKHVGSFSNVFPDRLAIDDTDRVASLDQDGTGISLLESSGKVWVKIQPRGQGYEFDRPVDLALDPLGHVYVLDRNKATVFVFTQGQQPKLVTTFNIAPKTAGYFKKATCFALDSAGRLYIYDEETEKILVYQ